MGNVKIAVEKLPVLFDEKRRPSSVVEDKKSLEVEGQSFVSYSPKAGYTYRFASFDDSVIKKHPVTTEENSPVQFVISCMSSEDGKTFTEDWFSLNHLNKRDAKNNPVHPTWAALGNVLKRAERLCELGEIKAAKEPRQIDVVVFGDNRKPLKVVERDAEGKPKVDADGNPVLINKTDHQDVYDLTPAN